MRIFFIDLYKVKQPLKAVLLIVITALVFTVALGQANRVSPVQARVQAICKAQTSHKVAALTFNINWGSKVPGPVLDILKTQELQATFFVSSAWAQKYPGLAGRIINEGHELGNCLDRQVIPGNTNIAELKEELLHIKEVTYQVTGVKPNLIRIAHGGWNEHFLSAAAEAGYTVVQWDLNSLDIQTPGKHKIINNVAGGVQPGSIILLNASDTASQTPGALTELIAALGSEGYELVTVSGLLQYGQGVTN